MMASNALCFSLVLHPLRARNEFPGGSIKGARPAGWHIWEMIEPPGRRIRDMMRPEAQARGRRLRSSRGRGLGLKAASYPEPEARGFNQNIIIEEDPLLTP